MLNIIDEYSPECVGIHEDRQIDVRKIVKRIFSNLINEHEAMEHIRSGDDSEFFEIGFREWLDENRSRRFILKRVVLGRMDTSRVSMHG